MFSVAKYLKPLPRKFNFIPKIDTVGILHKKTYKIKFLFEQCNFSFILRGHGHYHYKGEDYEIVAPAMFIEYPGAYLEYGPDGNWDEMFFIYDKDMFDFFKENHFFDLEHPVMNLSKASQLMEDVVKLQDMLSSEVICPDRIDMFCYYILEETMLRQGEEELKESLIPKIRAKLTANFGKECDINRVATEFGMSASTLRRYWHKHHGPETFSQYRAACFFRESCRLLVETDHSIKQIATELGLNDPYYFSRRFHELAGMTPTMYRRRNTIANVASHDIKHVDK